MELGAVLMGLLTVVVIKLAVLVIDVQLLMRINRARGDKNKSKISKKRIHIPQKHQPEMRIVWWSLMLFLISELTCGVEIFILVEPNPICGGLHAIFSAFGMALFSLGLYIFFNKKFVFYGRKRCIVNKICQGCTILDKQGCKFRSILKLIAVFLLFIAILPLFVSTDRLVADVTRYTLPFGSLNQWYDQVVVPYLIANMEGYDPDGTTYFMPQSVFFIEFHVIPWISLVPATIGTILLVTRKEILAAKFLVFAFGLLAYTYLELILYKATGDVILGSLGHEGVELWFLIAFAAFLGKTFAPESDQDLLKTQ